MDYKYWIERERRIRVRILKSSPQLRQSQMYRVCLDCGEICLCHEEICPNCNCRRIIEKKIKDIDSESKELIRCIYRFNHLEIENNKTNFLRMAKERKTGNKQ